MLSCHPLSRHDDLFGCCADVELLIRSTWCLVGITSFEPHVHRLKNDECFFLSSDHSEEEGAVI